MWHFGDNGLSRWLNAINTMMLGLLFHPAYGDLFEFWPLPPLAPSDEDSRIRIIISSSGGTFHRQGKKYLYRDGCELNSKL